MMYEMCLGKHVGPTFIHYTTLSDIIKVLVYMHQKQPSELHKFDMFARYNKIVKDCENITLQIGRGQLDNLQHGDIFTLEGDFEIYSNSWMLVNFLYYFLLF